MRNHSKVHATFLLLAMVLLFPVACLHGGSVLNPEEEIFAEMIYKGAICPSDQSEAHLRWIVSEDAYEALWKKQFSHLLGDSVPEPPGVDFNRYAVLSIHMGVQKTGGYALGLADSTVRVKGNVAMVVVDWTVPPSDAMVPQAVTQPCLLLKLKKGGYNRIEIFDGSGYVRLSIDLAAL
jgi:hypothetical protein